VQLTLVSTNPWRGPEPSIVVVATKDVAPADAVDAEYALAGAIDAAYELLVARRDLQPQEQFQVWQDGAQTSIRLGTLTILPDPAHFEYRAADAGGD
jgi:hypothetical protein